MADGDSPIRRGLERPVRLGAARWECLVVSSDGYNRIRSQYIIVEVVSERLSGDAILCDLGPVGVALTGAPFTVGPGWFADADEPIAVLDERVAKRAADQIRAILGP